MRLSYITKSEFKVAQIEETYKTKNGLQKHFEKLNEERAKLIETSFEHLDYTETVFYHLAQHLGKNAFLGTELFSENDKVGNNYQNVMSLTIEASKVSDLLKFSEICKKSRVECKLETFCVDSLEENNVHVFTLKSNIFVKRSSDLPQNAKYITEQEFSSFLEETKTF